MSVTRCNVTSLIISQPITCSCDVNFVYRQPLIYFVHANNIREPIIPTVAQQQNPAILNIF